MQEFNLELVNKKLLCENTELLSFKPSTAAILNFKAGQFISLHFYKDGNIVKRNYSIANAPNGDNIDIAISYVPNGLASTKLQSLQPGDKIEASGPFGIFVLKPDNIQRYLLISTGTGIAPYFSMIQELEQRLSQNHNFYVTLLQGIRYPSQAYFYTEFAKLAAQYPQNMQLIFCYSKAEHHNFAAHERSGYVQQQLDSLKCDPLQDIAYVCGNPNMVDEVYQNLTGKGFARSSIRREKYISAK